MSIYRYIVWYFKGSREYTKYGFETAAKNFVQTDLDVDCSSKSFMITGANSGLGYSTALEIAKRKGNVHMVCRNETTGQKAKESIIEETKNPNVYLHIVDMTESRKVDEFARKFSQDNSQLNVLINNAGSMVTTREKTSLGLDVNFATHTFGHYLLTNRLTDLLQRSEGQARVIFVSSGGMLLQKLSTDFNFDEVSGYNGALAYAQNKRQQVVMCEEFAKTHKEIFFASMHPGWADSPGVRSAMPDFYARMKDKLRSSLQGVDTIVWLAISPSVQQYPSGSFFQDRVPVAKHLPLAWTHSSDNENKEFMEKLSKLADTILSPQAL